MIKTECATRNAQLHEDVCQFHNHRTLVPTDIHHSDYRRGDFGRRGGIAREDSNSIVVDTTKKPGEECTRERKVLESAYGKPIFFL